MTDTIRDYFAAPERAIPDLDKPHVESRSMIYGIRSEARSYVLSGKSLLVEVTQVHATLTLGGTAYDNQGIPNARYARCRMQNTVPRNLQGAIKMYVDQLLAEFG